MFMYIMYIMYKTNTLNNQKNYMKNFIKNNYGMIIFYIVVVILFLNMSVCAGRYEGDPRAECSPTMFALLASNFK